MAPLLQRITISHSAGSRGICVLSLSLSQTKLQQWPRYLCWPPRICQTYIPTVSIQHMYSSSQHTCSKAYTGEISISSIWVSGGRSGQPGPGYRLLSLRKNFLVFYSLYRGSQGQHQGQATLLTPITAFKFYSRPLGMNIL